MSINVNLTPKLEQLVRQKVESGMYNSVSEVVREALRLMEEQDRVRTSKFAQLQRDIQVGLASGPATPWNMDDMKRQGKTRLRAPQDSSRSR